MSQRTRLNKAVRKNMRKFVNERIDRIYLLPFKKRLALAWRIVKGKKQ